MRLEEWQKYLEGEFLDEQEPDSAADLKSNVPPNQDGAASRTCAPSGAVSRQEADTWLPASSAFGTAPFLLSGNASVSRPPASLASACTDISDKAPTRENTDVRSTNRNRTARRTRSRETRPEDPIVGEPAELGTDCRAEIPRHVLQLLELGFNSRRSDREVAQSSYKRPFEESRQDLIARLLDPVLSLEEAARLLNVCPTTVRRYTNAGVLNYYRKETERTGQADAADQAVKETRQRRFRLSDILTFLASQERAPIER